MSTGNKHPHLDIHSQCDFDHNPMWVSVVMGVPKQCYLPSVMVLTFDPQSDILFVCPQSVQKSFSSDNKLAFQSNKSSLYPLYVVLPQI